MTPDDMLKLASDGGAKVVDFKFVDIPGTWQHFTIPMSQFDASLF